MNEIAVMNMNDQLTMAKQIAVSGLVPQGLNSPEKVFVALQWGKELGLSPMVSVNNIAVVNGKPTLSADILSAIARKSPEYGGVKWVEQSEKRAECEVTRKLANGAVEVTKGVYTWEDATKAGLVNKDNWKKYPARMLKHRAQSYALRDAFPDLLSGVYMPEEMESIPKEREIVDATPVEENKIVPKNTADLVTEAFNGTVVFDEKKFESLVIEAEKWVSTGDINQANVEKIKEAIEKKNMTYLEQICKWCAANLDR